jgi:hypothetical protein
MLSVGIKVENFNPPVCTAFDDGEGYFDFCVDEFSETYAQCGQMVDLYGDAIFEGQSLDILTACLKKLIIKAEKMPGSFQIKEAWGDEIMTVDRSALLERLHEFRHVVDVAMGEGKRVLCSGD